MKSEHWMVIGFEPLLAGLRALKEEPAYLTLSGRVGSRELTLERIDLDPAQMPETVPPTSQGDDAPFAKARSALLPARPAFRIPHSATPPGERRDGEVDILEAALRHFLEGLTLYLPLVPTARFRVRAYGPKGLELLFSGTLTVIPALDLPHQTGLEKTQGTDTATGPAIPLPSPLDLEVRPLLYPQTPQDPTDKVLKGPPCTWPGTPSARQWPGPVGLPPGHFETMVQDLVASGTPRARAELLAGLSELTMLLLLSEDPDLLELLRNPTQAARALQQEALAMAQLRRTPLFSPRFGHSGGHDDLN